MVIDIQQFEKYFGTKDTQRVLRAEDPSTPETERNELYRKVWNNRLVLLRREIRGYCKEQKKLNEITFAICTKLEEEEMKTFINQYLIKELEEELDFYCNKIDVITAIIANLGKMLLILLPFYEQLASDHDFAQIINANTKDVQRYRDDFKDRCNSTKRNHYSFFTALIFVYKIEPEGDQPFLNALMNAFEELYDEGYLKEPVWNKTEEYFPELKDCTVTLSEDENGPLIGQKYYPPLKLVK